MALLLTGLAAGAVVGGVAGGKAIQNKTFRDRARRIMIDCGPYFLNEGITVQDLWTDFEKRLLKKQCDFRATSKMDRVSFSHFCRELGYSESLTYLLLRTWLEGKRNPELVTQPYLRAMNNERYVARACPELQTYLETAPPPEPDAADEAAEAVPPTVDSSRLVEMPKVRQPSSIHNMPPTRSEVTPGGGGGSHFAAPASLVGAGSGRGPHSGGPRPLTYNPTIATHTSATVRPQPRRAVANGGVEEEW